jgi:hypothetical protein
VRTFAAKLLPQLEGAFHEFRLILGLPDPMRAAIHHAELFAAQGIPLRTFEGVPAVDAQLGLRIS